MPASRRIAVVLSDFILIVGALVLLIVVTAQTAAQWGGALAGWLVGAICGLLAVAASPALIILAVTPPPRPLIEGSALVARAAWFVRTGFAVVVFSLSIVLGAVAGVIASKVADSVEAKDAIAAMWTAAGQVALPTVGMVLTLLYIVMGVRWVVDLGSFIGSGEARKVIGRLIVRWVGPAEPSRLRRALTDFAELGADFGRLPLVGLLLVIFANVAVTLSHTVRG